MLTPVQVNSDIEAALYGYLMRRFPPLSNCGPETPLLESGAIDSLGILELTSFLGERFGITIDDGDFDPENFETPSRLIAMVARKCAK